MRISRVRPILYFPLGDQKLRHKTGARCEGLRNIESGVLGARCSAPPEAELAPAGGSWWPRTGNSGGESDMTSVIGNW